MIAQQIPLFKIKKGKLQVSSFCGLPLVYHIAHWLGIPEKLERALSLKRRRRGYSVCHLLMSLVLLIIGGGERLDDIRLLKADPALKALTDLKAIPDATTLGRLLRRFKRPDLASLARISSRLATRIQNHISPQQATLDVDSTVVVAHKEEAQKSYLGKPGYNPMFAFLAETKTVLRMEFRPGNASPKADALGFLCQSLADLPSSIDRVYLRSDSALYQAAVMDHCQDNHICFSITADRDKAVRELVSSLPEEEWRPFEEQELAETVHTLSKSKYAYRLIVLRRLKEQRDLFNPYDYGVMVTNREEDAAYVVSWHRKRADSENIIKEEKGGFALEHPPCGPFEANSAFSHIAVLAYNIIQAMKWLLLPESWRSLTIKSLRFRLLRLGGVIVRHARSLILKLPEDYHYFTLYESLAHRIRGPCFI